MKIFDVNVNEIRNTMKENIGICKMSKDITKIENIIVHGGMFHADDASCVALMKIINANVKVIRTLDREIIQKGNASPTTIVCDIGLGEFDHHQSDSPVRESGERYAAFGLLWRAVGSMLCGSQKVADKIDKNFIATMDALDNQQFGFKQHWLYGYIKGMNPNWDSSLTSDDIFPDAVEQCMIIISQIITNETAVERAEELINKYGVESEGNCLRLPKFIPYRDAIHKFDQFQYVAFPSDRGGITIIYLAKRGGNLFPKAWRGKQMGSDLPDYVTFCHNAGNLCCVKSWDYVGEAIEAAMKEVDESDGEEGRKEII